VFQYADGACFKILREWTVIDWCQFEPRAFNPIKWTHTQVIKVQNNVPPTITKGCNAGDLIVEDGGASCRSRMRLTAQGTDDCGGFVYFEYELDLDNNGTIDFKDHSSVIDKVVSYGNHRVVWFARDECGNVTRCERVFRVDDVKKPTPICHSQIVSVVMPSAKMITLWAKDFIKEGLDNCSPPTALKYSFTSNRRDSSKIFTCQDFVDNKVSGVPVRIYVFDTVGNSDYCDARLLLQDNSNVCTGTTAGAKLTVEGQIFDADQKPIEGVKVSILSTQPNFPVHMNTNKNGNYFFGDLKSGENYQWGAYKDEDANEGVNTLDIVAIQRHILAVSRFTNSSKLLAADVNKDQKITVGDIVQLRKLVLGVIDHFDSESWSFVATDQMPTMDDLYPVKSSFEISPMTKSEKNKNFTGIKLGDIDFSYNQTKLNGRSVMPMVMTKLPSQANARYGLKLEHISGLSGVQFDLKGNDLSRITEITFDNSKIDLAYHKVNDDITRVVILPNQGRVSIDQCELIITTKDDAELDVQLDKGYAFAAEGQEIITYDLALRNYRINTNGELIVYQNTPNPFEEHTEIAFEIPKDDDVTIKVFNNEGRIIYQTKSFYNKGIHKLKLSGQELDAKGLLYYQILTKTHYAGRRMIKLN
jgi:hypothetical protein